MGAERAKEGRTSFEDVRSGLSLTEICDELRNRPISVSGTTDNPELIELHLKARSRRKACVRIPS
jgi:hypothetical protein